jgi:beta-mannosidase
MRGRVRSISGHRLQPLTSGWEIAAAPPGAIADASALDGAGLQWLPTSVPSTAASSLRAAGAWSLDGSARCFDAEEWWYRARFAADGPGSGELTWLCCDGLATVADVWLNGTLLFHSASMFLAHERPIDSVLRRDNELVIRFRALDTLLRERRPRPRWRAPMVENQQLRWFRTTLLGRTPGWSPPAQAVGPWRGIRLEYRNGCDVRDVRIRADADGRIDFSARVVGTADVPERAELLLGRDGREHRLTVALEHDRLAARSVVPDVQRWWPHTHGEPALYAVRLRIIGSAATTDVDLGAVGFRSVALDTHDSGFALTVNDAPVFCRGACWTPLDPVSLDSSPDHLGRAFDQIVDAGMNMLRVGGMMVYEHDSFLDACDARGVLLWQDFMFANLQYPDEDSAFVAAVRDEVTQQVARLQGRPSVAVLCGNSEVEQQAAMWGAARDLWQPALFHEHIAGVARDWCPDIPYWPSSAHGGPFPHEASKGTTSYYGVGAYLRPLEDARRANVRFATECLAFANVPEARSLALLPTGASTKVHDPSWKARTPRDLGAGWDFDDVRDHYVEALFGVDPMRLRYAEHERYLAIGRVATGEVMAHVLSEWRQRRSTTRGALVWFLRDLWAGAGWGLIDAGGSPKAAWYYLRRALAPVAMSFSDEGGNGLHVHVVNDRASDLVGDVRITVYRFGEVMIADRRRQVAVPARSAIEINAAEFFDDFLDLSYAYRFGPASHDVVVGTFANDGDASIARAFHFVPGLPHVRETDIGLSVRCTGDIGPAVEIEVGTRRLAQSVSIEADGYEPNDNYFHLVPSEPRRISLRRVPHTTHHRITSSRCTVRALNCERVAATSLPLETE